jgi:nicotinamidase-related amidase
MTLAFGARDAGSDTPLSQILAQHRSRVSPQSTTRVFVLGLATDFVVKETLWELTGNMTQSEAVLVAAGTRGVFDAPGSFYGSDLRTSSGMMKLSALERGRASTCFF